MRLRCRHLDCRYPALRSRLLQWKGSEPVSDTLRLVADVGGTNVRIALARGARLDSSTCVSMPCARFPSLDAAIASFLDSFADAPTLDAVCIAVAGPVDGECVRMTNRDWEISSPRLRQSLGVRRALLINDFVAVSMAVPGLQQHEWVPIGADVAVVPGAPIAVLGPGTGLGVSALVPYGDAWIPVASEGGHASISPGDDYERELMAILLRQLQPVPLERVLSGPGLAVLYSAMSELEGRAGAEADAATIVASALADSAGFCYRVLDRFCAMLGSAAGNLALTYGAHGGVYLGGGILPRMAGFLADSAFRARFEAQGGQGFDYLAAIPTRLMTANYSALTGALA